MLHTWTCTAQLFPTSIALLERSRREGDRESPCPGNRAAERRGPVRLRMTLAGPGATGSSRVLFPMCPWTDSSQMEGLLVGNVEVQAQILRRMCRDQKKWTHKGHHIEGTLTSWDWTQALAVALAQASLPEKSHSRLTGSVIHAGLP